MANQVRILLAVCLAHLLALAAGPQLARAECEWDEGFPQCCTVTSAACGRKLSGNFRMLRCCGEYHFGPRPTPTSAPSPTSGPSPSPSPSPPPFPDDRESCDRYSSQDLACCSMETRACAEEFRRNPAKRKCCESDPEPVRQGQLQAACVAGRVTGLLNYCCPVNSDGRGCTPIHPALRPCCHNWRSENDREGTINVPRAVECAKRFQEMASRALTNDDDFDYAGAEDQPRFPMDCCEVRPFAQTCAAHKHSKHALNRALVRSVDQSRRNRDADKRERVSCSRKCLDSCCKDPADITRAAVRAASNRQLLACTWELLQNIISFKLEVPPACCSLPVFSLFCRSSSLTKDPPGPWSP